MSAVSAALQRLDAGPSPALEAVVTTTFHHGLDINADDPTAVTVSVFGASDAPDELPSYPPPIARAPEDQVKLWRALSDNVTHALAKSLLHDLLYLRRDGNVGAHAREAITLYLDAAQDNSVDETTRTYSALRALTLCRQTKQSTETPRLRQVLEDLAAPDLSSTVHNRPGATLPMVAALVETAPSEAESPGSQNDVRTLLEAALAAYGTSDHIDYIARIFTASGAVSDQRKLQVQRIRAEVRLDRARAETDPALRLFRLEEAASLAKDLGYTDLSEAATVELQQVDTESIEWKVFTSELQYRPQDVLAYVGQFTYHGDWKRGLKHWLSSNDAPSGQYDRNEALARQTLASSLLSQLIPRRRVGIHGMPERTGSQDSALDDKIREIEYRQAVMAGSLLLAALNSIGELAGGTGEEELAAFLVDEYRCHMANATILAKALLLFWRGEYLVVSHFVTPYIEAGVRTLLLTLNEPIYRVEVGKTKGQYAQLGSILPRLSDEGFDNDWIRYLQTLLLGEGQNHRNDLAHGFTRQMDSVVAVLLLRASALFLVMPLEAATAAEVDQLKARPTPRPEARPFWCRVTAAWSAAVRAFHGP
ncbi:hypothetical protein Y900_028560 [Mycolicibacterium aromaticivorans JS19b1 = JCM 16368]|uniref:DUF4209 domain-containing protein n=1 Tax=Mycolicibacterium aromaticivorans JS19b1 = JCM 16368 TaxID=1440774 RepID=A0A064C985_9MYCO|nr:hypothetical protein [Mycolicibacterium aromaticivorans]KDE97219.1 hypothetical protein Y900_028560 [Mycolicibacterium aromaticivorans JS19b1 = JCM 16368]